MRLTFQLWKYSWLASPRKVRHRHGEEAVALERRPARARLEQPDLHLAHARQVGGQPRHVQPRHPAGDRDLVRHAQHVEAAERERAHLDRAVDQLVVVARRVGAEAAAPRAARRREPGDHAPVGIGRSLGRQDVEAAARALVADRQQEHAAAVEEAVRRVQVRRAHRQVPGVDLVGQRQRPVRRRAAPGVLVELFDPHAPPGARLAGLQRRQAHDVARKLSHHVAARYPRGQHEQLAL